MLTCLVSQSQTLEAITITENKGQTEPPQKPEAQSFVASSQARGPEETFSTWLISHNLSWWERETLVENFHRPVQISCRASTVRWPLCDFGPDGFANVLRLGKRTCDLIYPWRLAKKKLSFRSLRNLSNPECTSVTQHRHTEIDANFSVNSLPWKSISLLKLPAIFQN